MMHVHAIARVHRRAGGAFDALPRRQRELVALRDHRDG